MTTVAKEKSSLEIAKSDPEIIAQAKAVMKANKKAKELGPGYIPVSSGKLLEVSSGKLLEV